MLQFPKRVLNPSSVTASASINKNKLGPGYLLFLSFLCFCAAAIYFLATSRYGIGVNTDSVGYASAAANLVKGRGFVLFEDGAVYSKWAPLFPVLIASFIRLGADAFDALRYFHLLLLMAVIFISGRMFGQAFRSRGLAAIGAAHIAFSFALQRTAVMALSEMLFTFLILILFISLLRFCRKPDASSYVSILLLSTLTQLQRYSGAAVTAAASLVILCGMRADLKRRIAAVFAFGFLSSLPLAAWLLRNHHLTGLWTGGRYESVYTLNQTLFHMAKFISGWLIPHGLPSIWMNGPWILFLPVMAAGVLLACLRLRRSSSARLSGASAAAIFILLNQFFIAAISPTGFPRVVEQYFTPFLPLYFLLLIYGFDHFSQKSPGRLKAASVALALLLIYPAALSFREAYAEARDGAGGYRTRVWQESPLIKRVRENRLSGKIYSNWPDALVFLAGYPDAKILPNKKKSAGDLGRGMDSEAVNVVWFRIWKRESLHPVEDYVSALSLAIVSELPDGTLYRMRK